MAQRRRPKLRLSMCLIARNEAHNVERCFASFWEHVDEVVLVDTGSRDGTIGEARRFARERGEPGKLIVRRFEWCDDFAAARNAAEDLATGDVRTWCDLDQRVIGAENFPTIVQAFAGDPELDRICGGRVDYPDAGDSVEQAALQLQLQLHVLFVRAPVTWVGRVWEFQRLAPGAKVATSAACGHWHAQRNRGVRRDLKLALARERDEPDSILAAMLVARESMALGIHDEDPQQLDSALTSWRRVVSMIDCAGESARVDGPMGDVGAPVLGEMCGLSIAQCLLYLGRLAEARKSALRVYDDAPSNMAALIVAKAAARLGAYDEAARWAARARKRHMTHIEAPDLYVDARLTLLEAQTALNRAWDSFLTLTELERMAPNHPTVRRCLRTPQIAHHPMLAAARAAASVEHER